MEESNEKTSLNRVIAIAGCILLALVIAVAGIRTVVHGMEERKAQEELAAKEAAAEEYRSTQKRIKEDNIAKAKKALGEAGYVVDDEEGTVIIGSYEQDDDFSDGKEPIKWLILGLEKSQALLVSEYALEYYPGKGYPMRFGWKTSGLKFWLEEEFAPAAGLDAVDGEITLLEPGQVKLDMAEEDRVCLATEHLRASATTGAISDEQGEAVYWWNRSSGWVDTEPMEAVCCVSDSGDVVSYKFDTVAEDCPCDIACWAVRPALLVDVQLPPSYGDAYL